MNAIDAILTRRSIRKYTDQPISDELIKQLLEAAMAAPSAGNQQPWHFIVVQDKETLKQVQNYHPYAKVLENAAAAILICADESIEKHKGYWVQDCSAATQNMLIAANALGLGAVWIGLYPTMDRLEPTRKLLGIPESIIPLAFVSIGYPDETKEPANRYDEARVHKEKW